VTCLSRQHSILRPHGNLPLSPGRRRWSLLLQHARWGSTSPSALGVAQDSPSNQTDELTAPEANDSPRETSDANESIYRIEGLRDIQEGAIRQDDEEIEESVSEAGVEESDTDEPEWMSRSWTGSGIDILWFKNLDHAQVFDRRATRRILISAIRSYCEEK